MRILLDWWRERPGREQALLLVAAAALLVTGAFLAIEPIFQETARKRAEIPKLRSDLRWMRRHAAEIQQLRGQAGGPAEPAGQEGPILQRIERTIQAQGLREALSELQEQGGNGARLKLEDVAFPALLDWLKTLRDRGGIGAVKADIRRPEDAAAGRVDAELVLRRQEADA